MFDFGLAKRITNADKAEDDLYHLTGNTGSLRYMAPEVVREFVCLFLWNVCIEYTCIILHHLCVELVTPSFLTIIIIHETRIRSKKTIRLSTDLTLYPWMHTPSESYFGNYAHWRPPTRDTPAKCIPISSWDGATDPVPTTRGRKRGAHWWENAGRPMRTAGPPLRKF